MSNSELIVVTGATGWVGRTLLDQLSKVLEPTVFSTRVRAFGSGPGLIVRPDRQPISVHPLTALPHLASTEAIGFLLHAAFLTPDRCADVGRDVYCKTNQSITRLVCSALQSSPSARAVLFSSGAAAVAASADESQTSAFHLYGLLKLEEERLISEIVPTLILRIYALSGRHIRDPRRYALGDFLHQALHGKPVEVKSPRRVVRGYVHADSLADLALHWMLGFEPPLSGPLNAVSHRVDLTHLAQAVVAIYGNPRLVINATAGDEVDDYSANPAPFLAQLNKYGLCAPTLEQQIRDTALAFNVPLPQGGD